MAWKLSLLSRCECCPLSGYMLPAWSCRVLKDRSAALVLCVQGLKAADAVVVAHIPIVFMLAQHPTPVAEPSQPA